MQNKYKILGTVKVDKLSFGIDNVTPDLAKKIDEVIGEYYEESNNSGKFSKLIRTVTPTKQKREDYKDFNHNLQMIPLEQFLMFLKELRKVTGRDINVYEVHLAKDIKTYNDTSEYIDTLLNHEYLNSYHAYREEANSPDTLYISRKKDLNSNGDLKLLIKFYNKAKQLLHKANMEKLPLKEPVDEPKLETEYNGEKMTLSLENLNMLRCEIELRENYLPYTTIDKMVEALENGTFQGTLEIHYNKILNKIVFAKPKQKTSCSKLKQIAIKLMNESKRDYKTLFDNAGKSREYNYFKRAKEATTRENDPNFEKLRRKLINEQFKYSS